MAERGSARKNSETHSVGRVPDSLERELERLRWLVVHTMDGLAEQVLDQIQTTRGLAQQTDSLLAELRRAGASAPEVEGPEAHIRQVCSQIEEAIRDLPESSWDDFAQTCTQLARTLHWLSDAE